ncbi:serine/threonine-protein phosphatase 4 regulatory subunit 2 [Nilaparvata lugens]|uniref:serine/threonine-protein phosphatase 4 regulatory subunit 2 n=1 Tax=Nilaparvata lugens TaxID=108931 RepID=UPI00193E361F|nr:serine/threonine-protein phosphatase 4 regulatory subunit 2 [Nilaparvata lugens]
MSEIVRFVMDNAEEILQSLESFSKLKPKEIPKELDEYLGYVARTGDPVYQWQYVKCLFHEKLLKVITEFYENSPSFDNPPCPNVDPFNYERMKTSLLERLDNFHNAPFTVQRICELLTSPRKHYGRVDKFMRAIEKTILVVSTREPGFAKRSESDETVLSVNGVPENRDHETAGDNRVNLPHDGIASNNATCSPSITVENAVNSCVIQEEIEINSASSTSTAEEKGWVETNESKMAVDPSSQATSSQSESGNNISNSDVVSTSSDMDKASASSSSTFIESDAIPKSEDSSTTDQSKLTNVPTGAESPESPEPHPDEVLCDASSDEDSCSNQKNYSENFPLKEESQTSEVADSEKVDEPEQLDSTPDSEAVSVLIKNSESLQQIDSTEEQQESSLNMTPDSSNECFKNDESENEESNVAKKEEESESGTISSSQVQIQEELVESAAVVSEDTPDMQKTEDLGQVELPESEVVSEGTAVSDNVVSESESSVSIEEVTDPKEAEEEVEIVNKETDVEAEASIEKEVIVEEEEEEEVDKKAVEESQDGLVEVSGSSTFEVTEEEAAEEEEEEPRESGSVIHTTQSVCSVEEELEVEAVSSQAESAEDKLAVEENQVESICIDQSSCEATSEAEAMEVDDNTSNQMAIGEVEMNEEEPMDQSDQTHP